MIGLLKVVSVAGGVIAIGSISSGALVALMPTIEGYFSKKEEIKDEAEQESEALIKNEEKEQKDIEIEREEAFTETNTTIEKPTTPNIHNLVEDKNPLQTNVDQKEEDEEEINKQTEELQKRIKRITALSEEVTQIRATITSSQQQMQAAETALTQQKESLKALEKEHSKTNQELIKAKTKKTDFENSVRESTTRLEALKALLVGMGLKQEKITESLTGIEVKIEDLLTETIH